MKGQKALFTILLGVFVATAALAQTIDVRPLTKKELSEWKKRKKKLTVEEFKRLSDENVAQKAQIAASQGEIENLERQLSSKDDKISELQKQVTRMQAAYQVSQREINNLKSQPNRLPMKVERDGGEDFSVGVVFKVQVGAFRKIDLNKYANSSKDFSEEEMEELRKYVIGNFRNYDDANVLKRYLREMGVEDAWIVPYRDGKRVPLKDVLDIKKVSN
ncbi:hypothetical protein [Roseivirga misakiensis]|uniref:Ezrin/radixin/moesin family protein n=1 Tax=Roseivirga misakiensis TaxID=1563681 RepID=A0A1E5T6F6_9BACT|nr:hypothetical protein [Roseivirga misakiensis]OEK06928.1 hypothetical protein BFP71_04540 [Roseivirga misakiensis]